MKYKEKPEVEEGLEDEIGDEVRRPFCESQSRVHDFKPKEGNEWHAELSRKVIVVKDGRPQARKLEEARAEKSRNIADFLPLRLAFAMTEISHSFIK